MTLHEVIHGVAFAQAFNFYLQQRSLIPPGALGDGFNTRIAFAQDLEAAQEYAHAQADLAWTYYQKITPSPIYEWTADEPTNPYDSRGHSVPRPTTGPRSAVTPRPSAVPPPPPLARTVRDPQQLKSTVRVPVETFGREWKNDDVEPPPLPYQGSTFPY